MGSKPIMFILAIYPPKLIFSNKQMPSEFEMPLKIVVGLVSLVKISLAPTIRSLFASIILNVIEPLFCPNSEETNKQKIMSSLDFVATRKEKKALTDLLLCF
jgi:hypothetical protein